MTGCPDVSDTPYMGAVVLYRVRQRRPPPQELDAIGVRPGRFVARPEKKSKNNNQNLYRISEVLQEDEIKLIRFSSYD